MRYPASEKLEIIRTVETSPLPVRQTLARIGIPKSTFYAWLDRHAAGGLEGLEDRKPRPGRVWNRIPDEVRHKDVALTSAAAIVVSVPSQPSSSTTITAVITKA
jgi:putative transposase